MINTFHVEVKTLVETEFWAYWGLLGDDAAIEVFLMNI